MNQSLLRILINIAVNWVGASGFLSYPTATTTTLRLPSHFRRRQARIAHNGPCPSSFTIVTLSTYLENLEPANKTSPQQTTNNSTDNNNDNNNETNPERLEPANKTSTQQTTNNTDNNNKEKSKLASSEKKRRFNLRLGITRFFQTNKTTIEPMLENLNATKALDSKNVTPTTSKIELKASSEKEKKKPAKATNALVSKNVTPTSKVELKASSKKEKKKPAKTRRGTIRRFFTYFQWLALGSALIVVSPFISDELSDFWEGRTPSARQRAYSRLNIDDEDVKEGKADEDIKEERTDEDVKEEKTLDVKAEKAGADEHETATAAAPQELKNQGSELPISAQERRHQALAFVTEAVEKIGPSVLRIDTETQYLEDDEGLPPSPGSGFVQEGQGSGLIFSSDGLILTNAHVVEDATKVTVTLTDGRVYQAEVRGADEIVDIAVLKILRDESSKLPVADLGDSDALNVGQIVVAVGTPGGLDNTVTMGIVSGLERSSTVVGVAQKRLSYIQTDAAINPGNSGGPLVDVETGTVVGINAAIRAHMEGTSFAIPINRVREIMHDLADGQQIHHGYLGISLSTCTPDWARQNNERTNSDYGRIPEVQGALVHKVFPRTPAEKGGLRENDVILKVDGKKVESADDARTLIDGASVGKDLHLSILRDSRHMVLAVRPVDLATRLKEIRRERQQQLLQEKLRFQELGPFRGERYVQ